MDNKTIVFDLKRYLVAKAEKGFRTDSRVAEAAGVTRARFSTIVSGSVPPDDTQKAIARALEVRVSDLWVSVDIHARARR